ncbi:MAG TPA: hypothetical protein VJ577_17570 [Burkholderiaceae bacterium]|nr:hypothetical protein [Burkholderiaceae bacterium]
MARDTPENVARWKLENIPVKHRIKQPILSQADHCSTMGSVANRY